MKKRSSSGENKGFFEYGGSFYHYTGKVCDVMLLSLIWLVSCIPVITIGASFSALYASASRCVRRNIGSVLGEYWKSYRREMKNAIPLWLIFGGAIFLLLLNLGIIWKISDGLFRLFLIMFYGICLLLVLTAMCYAFPALSRFDMPVGWFVKLAFYMTFRNLHISVVMMLLFGVGYVIVLSYPWTAIFMPGVLAVTISSMVDPALDRHAPT